ncbi:unnamed protein product [Musa acuminata subsp. malaccensis]|uniref:(wild Malaysian banana) hypothetical protein n=1 Tax=Musa acuminata subsp. malaccensis TaxID=214687 RepID=A0A804K994_MUSAM|nr:unnamed protein product [Musa acuminata subsp. malaccensis]
MMAIRHLLSIAGNSSAFPSCRTRVIHRSSSSPLVAHLRHLYAQGCDDDCCKKSNALVLQRDRNLVIYGPALWATGTRVLVSAGVVVTQKSTSAVGKPKNKSISIHGK